MASFPFYGVKRSISPGERDSELDLDSSRAVRLIQFCCRQSLAYWAIKQQKLPLGYICAGWFWQMARSGLARLLDTPRGARRLRKLFSIQRSQAIKSC